MKIEIRHRFSNAVLFTAVNAASEADALQQAFGAGVDLAGASLIGAWLEGCNLRGGNLRGANLSGAALNNANLSGANLSGANLTDADLTGADLTSANLTDTILTNAMLTGTSLTPEQLTQLGLSIPHVQELDRKMLEAVTAGGGHLDMSQWHRSAETAGICGSTHCRAGWTIHLAGPQGYALEDKVGPFAAGSLIYLQSTQRPVPDFWVSNEQALADIRSCAEGAAK